MTVNCQELTAAAGREYMSGFSRKMARLCVPVSGSIELTRRCNLRCAHCYLPLRERAGAASAPELGTDRHLALIDEIARAGCLNLLLTGGEALLRSDFPEIYRRAIECGLLVTVFSNGTTVTKATLGLFAEFPPQAVEISLYGATAATCERVTGVPGSHRRCIEGIEGLLANGTRVRLKTMLLSSNRHELEAIENIARSYGAKFRFDPALNPRFDGDRTPLSYRVSPEEAVRSEFADSARADNYRRFYTRSREASRTDLLYQCGAGRTNFHIDPYGTLQPCLMTTSLGFPLADGPFSAGWEEIRRRMSLRLGDAGNPCVSCEKKSICGYCPASFLLEQGSEQSRSAYLCELGEHRHAAIMAMEEQPHNRQEEPCHSR